LENNELTHDPAAVDGATLQFGTQLAGGDVIIRNNLIHDTFGEAIYVGSFYDPTMAPFFDGVLVENNVIHHAGRYGGQGDCVDIKAGLSNVMIRGNICHDSIGYPAESDFGNVNGIPAISPITAVGNVIYNQPTSGILAGRSATVRGNLIFHNGVDGVYCVGGDAAAVPVACDIEHNTLFANARIGILFADNGAGGVTGQILANLVIGNGYGLSGWGAPTYTISGNDFFGNSSGNYTSPFDVPSVVSANLSTDPLFVNSSNPPGADGRFFTSDDGFTPQAAGVCSAGAGAVACH
jgi:hypothetical protein